MDFEWDPEKSEANYAKHGVGFVDATEVLSNPYYGVEVDHPGPERRHVAIGPLPAAAIPPEWSGPLCAVFYTKRGTGNQTYRLFSARRARENERQGYRDHVGRGGPASP